MIQLPSPDPNWFYSSVAQPGAAVVGLLGGVLATRFQAQLGDAREARAALVRAVLEYRDKLQAIRSPLDAYLAEARDIAHPLALATRRNESHEHLPARRTLRGGPVPAERVELASGIAETLATKSRAAKLGRRPRGAPVPGRPGTGGRGARPPRSDVWLLRWLAAGRPDQVLAGQPKQWQFEPVDAILLAERLASSVSRGTYTSATDDVRYGQFGRELRDAVDRSDPMPQDENPF